MPMAAAAGRQGTTEITCRVSLEALGTGLGDYDGGETVVRLKSRRAAAALWLSDSSSASRCAPRIERVQGQLSGMDSCLEGCCAPEQLPRSSGAAAVRLQQRQQVQCFRVSRVCVQHLAQQLLRLRGRTQVVLRFWSSETYRMCVAVAGEGCCECLLAADHVFGHGQEGIGPGTRRQNLTNGTAARGAGCARDATRAAQEMALHDGRMTG